MLDERKIEESTKIIKEAIKDGIIITSEERRKLFFLEKSKLSLEIARKLMKIQAEEKLNTNMWVINTSYYSMFFAATALLAYYNHKINSEIGIHKLTYHALVYYFVKENNKLKHKIAEQYQQAIEDAEELLQLGENRVKQLIINLDYEQNKRKRYTYEIGQEAERSKAEISLQRAEDFVDEIKNLLTS